MQQFTYSYSLGSHPYFVYTPGNYQVGKAVPLIVMLHGCTQTALDFAAGTQMNSLADEYNFIVAYPQQHRAINRLLSWKCFTLANQSLTGKVTAVIPNIIHASVQVTSSRT